MLQPQPNGYVLYVLVKQHYFTEIFLILRVVSYLLQKPDLHTRESAYICLQISVCDL